MVPFAGSAPGGTPVPRDGLEVVRTWQRGFGLDHGRANRHSKRRSSASRVLAAAGEEPIHRPLLWREVPADGERTSTFP